MTFSVRCAPSLITLRRTERGASANLAKARRHARNCGQSGASGVVFSWDLHWSLRKVVLIPYRERNEMTMQTRVLIADDRPRSRNGLKALLALRSEIQVVGEAANGREAVRLVEELRPDVVLMDAKMPGMDGPEATRIIKERWPKVKIIVLTMYPEYQAHALAAGVDAFLVKGGPAEDLVKAILDQQQEVRK